MQDVQQHGFVTLHLVSPVLGLRVGDLHAEVGVGAGQAARHDLEATVIGRHGGGSATGKATAELSRLADLRRYVETLWDDVLEAFAADDPGASRSGRADQMRL